MDQRKRLVIAGSGGAMLLALTVSIAWPQVQEAMRPRPFEVTLQPERADEAALEQARASPLARRLAGVLAQQTNFAPAIATSDVPVLAPPDVGLLQTAQFHPGDRQYTLTVEREGQVIEIYGATRALQPPPGAAYSVTFVCDAPAAVARAEARGLEDVRTERTEYGVDVSFTRFGAAYSVTFVCDAVGAPNCTEAAAIQFAAALELVGGGER